QRHDEKDNHPVLKRKPKNNDLPYQPIVHRALRKLESYPWTLDNSADTNLTRQAVTEILSPYATHCMACQEPSAALVWVCGYPWRPFLTRGSMPSTRRNPCQHPNARGGFA